MVKQKTIRRKIRQISSIVLATIVLILIGIVLYFYINRDRIEEELLESINSNLRGELVVDAVELDLLTQFPNISLVLKESQYFESKQRDSTSQSSPIIGLKKLYCEIKPSSLMHETVQINGLHLEEGKVHFVLSTDSVFNFSQIIIPQDKDVQKQRENHFGLSLDNFSIHNISLEYKDFLNDKDYALSINEVSSSFNIKDDSILMTLNSDYDINHIPISNDIVVTNKRLLLKTDVVVLRNDSTIKMSKMEISVGDLSLKSEGLWSYGTHKELYIDFSLSNNFSYLNRLLPGLKGVNSIKSGEAYLEGSIIRHQHNSKPLIKGTYGINNLEFSIPKTDRELTNFNLKGSFNSGNDDKYSSAIIICDTIYGHSQTGYLNGKFSLEDFSQPRVKASMNLSLDVTKYDEVFDLDFISDLSGQIDLQAEMEVHRTKDLKWHPKEGGELSMQIKDLTLSIPELIPNEEKDSKIAQFIYHNNYAQVRYGTATINADVKHEAKDTLPVIDLNYDLSEFRFTIPEMKQNLEAFKISGNYNSGQAADLSEAIMTAETLSLKLGESTLQGNFTLLNRVKPKVKASLGLSLNLDDFSQVIPDSMLQNLEGRVGLNLEYDGGMLNDSTWIMPSSESVKIKIDKLRCRVPAINDKAYLDGMLSGSYDSLHISGLDIETGNTQLTLKGDVLNITSMSSDYKDIHLSNGKIIAECFDLPQFIQWLPTTPPGFKDRFGYKIKDADVNVDASFTKDLYATDKTQPFVYVDVASGFGKMDSLLPPFDIGRVKINIAKDKTTKIISFPELELIFDEASASGNLYIYANEMKYDSLKTNLILDKIQPNELLTYYKADSLKHKDTTLLNGNFDIFMSYDRVDKFRKFENLNLNLSDIEYQTSKDTLVCEKFQMLISDVIYDNKAKPSMLASLSANSSIDIKKTMTKVGYINSINTTLTAKNGEFYISDISSDYQSESARGELVYKPYATPAMLSAEYRINEFSTDELFRRLNTDPLINGFVSMDLKLKAQSTNTEELLETLEGSVLVKGENLILYGLELDKLMYKIDRTQNFNLIDVAGLVVAGPLGLVVTKGANATSIFINNKEDSTHINAVTSVLTVDSGIVILSDVAFSTVENRVALKGNIDLPKSALNIRAAIVDSNGVATWQQGVDGNFSDPKISEIKPVKSILKPIDNLVKDVFDVDGDVFYNGTVNHPTPQ